MKIHNELKLVRVNDSHLDTEHICVNGSNDILVGQLLENVTHVYVPKI